MMIYHTPEWRKLRAQVVARNKRDNGGRCNCCRKVIEDKATVDHIETVKSRPDLAFNPTNLRVLCASCDNARHSEKGGIDRPTIGHDGYPTGSGWA